MSSDPIRFIAVVKGKPRCVLSAYERTSGDLLLNIRAKQLLREPGVLIESPSADPKHGEQVVQSRYSVHMSPKSTVANLIKLTCVLANGEEINSFNYSSGIKQTNMFAPIYSRRCTVMEDDTYDVENIEKQDIVLGEWAQPAFTLMFTVFVGPNRTFDRSLPKIDFRFRQVNFSEFSIVLFWSFLGIPAHVSGMLSHIGTRADIGPTSANSDAECKVMFDWERVALRSEYLQTLSNLPGIESAMPWMREAIFFGEPRMETKRYRMWAQSMINRGLMKEQK